MARGKIDPQRRLEIGRERRARTRANIIAAAFELFGGEDGLHTRIEDIADRAGITRPTFYNHFRGLQELRDALTFEVTHDLLVAVTQVLATISDPRERASVAIRYYLERVRRDRRWGWSMVNLSANGIIFGAETHQQAEVTVRQGMEEGLFDLPSSAIGRDLVLGTSLAAMATMVRQETTDDYPRRIARQILLGLGVPAPDAEEVVARQLPALPYSATLQSKVDRV